MAKKRKDVELIPDDSIASKWKVKHDGFVGDAPNGPKKYPEIVLPQGDGPHLIVYRLPDNVTATFNKNDPIWVHKGTTSPLQKEIDDQIVDWEVFDGGKTLVLLDKNTEQGYLSYRVKAENYDHVLDPIIRNGGTAPPAPTMPSYSAIEIAVAGLSLLLAFLVGFYVHRRFFAPMGVAPKT